ncbi:MAG: hypothetical protein IJI01_14320 [Butyrivibrio sp.]|uniref:hypothetical protein n=1 Tax=Butyrivibrio sp. TaxID=28121 RepID=UPI0025BB41EA|nr:hypothetical protein [Butyrivibrio sp.]MBQ6589837.1 hypothetical protein [Butyrivibrio sp.]
MKKSEFREILASRINSQEAEMLRTSDLGLYISDFNRDVCLRILDDHVPDEGGKR